jgi:membrane protease YdiL (CAAX protease family)
VPGETPEVRLVPQASSQLAPPPGPKLWSWRNLIFFIAWAGLAQVAANLLVLAGYLGLQPLLGWQIPPQALRHNTFFLLALQAVFYGLVVGYVYLLVAANYRQPFWAALGWHKPTNRQALLFFLGGTMLAVVVELAPAVLPDREDFPLLRLFSSPLAAYALAAFAVFVAPFMEELIFRGVLFRFCEHLVGIRFAVVSTAILFAGLHVPEYWGAWNHVLLISLVGVVFSLARGLTGSLAPSVVLHLAYNTGLMVAFFFETHQFRAFGAATLF